MGLYRYKKLRTPVFSRLTIAWFSALTGSIMIAVLVGHAALFKDDARRVSLAIEQLEVVAKPTPEPVLEEENAYADPNTPGLRLSSPTQTETPTVIALTEVDDTIAEDILLLSSEVETLTEPEPYTSDDIRITIAGASVKPTPVTKVSYNKRPPRPIRSPEKALLQDTTFGTVPQIGPDGRQALDVYASPFQSPNNKAKIALIVGGLGLNPSLTKRAIDELPPEVSLAFAPYAQDLKRWTEQAKNAGHEVIIELPMEGYSGNDAALGTASLLTSRSEAENLQRLDWLMSRFEGYFAATNYLGAKFNADPTAITPILQTLAKRGIAYVDDTGAAANAKHANDVAIVTVSRIIPPAPNESRRDAVRRELKALEMLAIRDGSALGKTYAYAATIDEIIEWSKQLDDTSFVLAPSSALLSINHSPYNQAQR